MSGIVGHVGLLAGAAFQFSPLDLPGIQGWFDAADAASVIQLTSLVSQWNDKSGAGRHATQANVLNQFTYAVGAVNSRNAMTSSGNSWMDFTATSNTGQFWAFAVGGNAKGSRGSMFLTTGGSNSYALGLAGSDLINSVGSLAKDLTGVGSAASNGSINCFGIWQDGTDYNVFFNAIANTYGGGGSMSVNGLFDYPFGGGDGFSLNGTICEIFFGHGPLILQDALDAAFYLKNKWSTP